MSRKTKLIIAVSAIILLGFIRDYFFTNINWIYMNLTVNRPNQALDEFHFLLSWTPEEINLLKWFLTFLFTGLFMLFTYLVVQISFQNKTYTKITLAGYSALVMLALFLYGISVLIGITPNLYGIIRTLMGIAQSFMPLMIFYILFKFLPLVSERKS